MLKCVDLLFNLCQVLSRCARLHYITFALHPLWIAPRCVTWYTNLHGTRVGITLNSKNRNAPILLLTLPAVASALRCIMRASHSHHVFRYVSITSVFRFALNLRLALNYVRVALRAGGRIHVTLTLIRGVLISRQFNASTRFRRV